MQMMAAFGLSFEHKSSHFFIRTGFHFLHFFTMKRKFN